MTSKRYTIKEAIVEVLQRKGAPLTVQEIYSEIQRGEYYEFKSQSPVNVIATEIRRHCEGSTQSANRPIVFSKVQKNKYRLK